MEVIPLSMVLERTENNPDFYSTLILNLHILILNEFLGDRSAHNISGCLP